MRDWIFFGALAATVACSSNKELPDPGEGGGGNAAAGGAGGSTVQSLDWQPCPLITDGAGQDAQCAMIEVPLDWESPGGRTIELFVKRKLASEGPSRGDIWMLAGGPGQPGVGFEGLVQALAPLDPTLSFYLLDHRGVGRSTPLQCPDQEALTSEGANGITLSEWPACIEHVRGVFSNEELSFFSTTQAAHDVGKLIDATHEPGGYVAVWGASYGSHWSNRYLSLYPEQPDLVILSAIAANAKLSAIDEWMDRVGRQYLSACAADYCQAKFSDAFNDTVDNVAAVTMGGAQTSFCAPIASLGWTPAIMKTLFGQFMYSWENRKLVPAIIYRLARCDAADVSALTNMALAVSQQPESLDAQQRLWGNVLGPHIILSELWDPAATQADLQAIAADAIVTHGAPQALIALFNEWPRYAAPSSPLAHSSARVVLFHGELDFIGSDVYQPVVDHFGSLGKGNNFMLVPRAPHSLQSPLPNGSQCGISMLWAQLQAPEAQPADCSADVQPLDFLPAAALSLGVLGTADAWEGDPGASMAKLQPAPSASPLSTALAQYRRLYPAHVARLRAAIQRP